ncbi:MAG: peptidylprolyl isomerase [Blastocatellia bacterium]
MKISNSFKLAFILSIGVLVASCSEAPKPAATPAPTPAVVAVSTPAPTPEVAVSPAASPSPADAKTDAKPAATSDTIATIDTGLGVIKVKLFPDVAPKHIENFKKLAKEGFFNGTAFHRAVPNLLIQGGDPNTRSGDRESWGMGAPGQQNVPAEFNDRPFKRGVLGMARRGGDVNSATSQFFICLRDFPQWNGQYTVFGEVVEGIEVVDKIATQPTDQSQRLLNKVVVNKVTVQAPATTNSNAAGKVTAKKKAK